MGTDRKGRDVAVRIVFGTRISISVGVIAVGIYVTIGMFLGAFAGFFRGRVDMIIQRVIEIFMSVPTLIVLLVMISFIEKPSIFHIMVGIVASLKLNYPAMSKKFFQTSILMLH